MRQMQHLGIIAGMMALSSLESPESAERRNIRWRYRSPEQNDAARLERKKKKQHRNNKKRNRK